MVRGNCDYIVSPSYFCVFIMQVGKCGHDIVMAQQCSLLCVALSFALTLFIFAVFATDLQQNSARRDLGPRSSFYGQKRLFDTNGPSDRARKPAG